MVSYVGVTTRSGQRFTIAVAAHAPSDAIHHVAGLIKNKQVIAAEIHHQHNSAAIWVQFNPNAIERIDCAT